MSEVANSCRELCPKYALCEKMVQTGLAHLMLADSATGAGGVEFEAEDGRLVDSAGFFGTSDMPQDQIELHQRAGESLRDGGQMLQQSLLNGCIDGPLELGTGQIMCQSANRNEIDFTEEDLR